jgi:hypothetical protein
MKELKTKAEVAEAILEETVVDRKGSKPTYDLMFDCGLVPKEFVFLALT